MAIKFGDRLVNINPDYALIDLSDNQTRGVAFFQNGITESALTDVPADKRVAGMLGVDVANDKVFIFTGTQAQADNIDVFHIAPLDANGDPANQQAPDNAIGGTYWEEIGTVERRFTNIPVAIGDGKTFGKYRNDYDHPAYPNNIGIIPVTDIGGGQGMTALEIIIEALSEAQSIPVQFDVYDDVNPVTDGLGVTDLAGASNPDGQFAFGQQSGTVGYSITANNINVNLVDDQGVAASLDTANTSATCAIKYRRRGSSDAFENFVNSIALSGPDANGDFTASGTQGWSTTDEFDDFDGFEFKVEVTDTLGMQGSTTDSIGVSTYVPPAVTFTAERDDDTSTQFMVNESDAHRMPGNVNTVLNWTIDPQVQDGLAGSEIQVTGYQIYRKTLSSYTGTPPNADNDTGWSALSGSAAATGLSITSGTSSFTFTDDAVPHDAKFLAYRIVVTDDHLSTTSEADAYYEALPAGGSLTQNPGNYNDATAIAYYASFSESGTTSGSQGFAEMKAPMFFFFANINGGTAGGQTIDSLSPLTAFPSALPGTLSATFGNDTLTGFAGAFFDNAGTLHHANSKILATNETAGVANGFPTTFSGVSSGAPSNNFRLIIAIPEPYGGTPPEISSFTTDANNTNQIPAFQTGLVDISLPGGPATGGNQVDPLPEYQYRIYVQNQSNTLSQTQIVTLAYS